MTSSFTTPTPQEKAESLRLTAIYQAMELAKLSGVPLSSAELIASAESIRKYLETGVTS